MAFASVNQLIMGNFIRNSQRTYRLTKPHRAYTLPPAPNINVIMAITRAYADTQRTCHFISRASYTSGIYKGNNVLKTIFDEIYRFVCNIATGIITNANFDTEHDILCSSLCGPYSGVNSKGYNGSSAITYGHAQKILNMTLKYLYVEQYYRGPLRPPLLRPPLFPPNIEDSFHCPVDSYILHSLKIAGTFISPHITISGKIPNTSEYYNNPHPRATWSNLNQQQYKDFLKNYRASLLPGIKQLEAEFHLWSNPKGILSPVTVAHFGLPNNTPASLKGVLLI